MGGGAVNGWRFWSLEGDTTAASTASEAKTEKPKAKNGKSRKTIYRNPNQQNLAEGKTRWFCVACMKGFVTEGSDAPAACPEGHPVEDLQTATVAP
jgi:rubrerythrin